MHTKRATAGVAVIALVLAGCGGGSSSRAGATTAATNQASPTLAPTATLPSPTPNTVGLADGWQRVRGDGFSIDLPSSWAPVAATDIADSNVMDALRESNPAAGPVIDSAEAAMRAGQIQLFAFDPGPRTMRSGFATNVNLIHVGDIGGDLESLLDEMERSVSTQVPVNGRIRTSTTTLPAGPAAVLRYEWTVRMPAAGAVDLAVTQYVVTTDGNGYIITLTGPTRFARHDRPFWDAVAFSFRWG